MADKVVKLSGKKGPYFWSSTAPALEFSDTWIRLEGQAPWTVPSPIWGIMKAVVRLSESGYTRADVVEAAKINAYFGLFPNDWTREAIGRIVSFVGSKIVNAANELPIAELSKRSGIPADKFIPEAELRSQVAGLGRDLKGLADQLTPDFKKWAIIGAGVVAAFVLLRGKK